MLTRTSVRALGTAFGVVLLGVVACVASDGEASHAAGGGNGSGGGINSGSGGIYNGDGEPLPPEEELEEDFEVPAAVGRFLWAANPKSNRVALVDAKTYETQAFDAGFAPTYLAGLPPAKDFPGGAVVLNELSQDATLYLLPKEGPVNAATIVTHTVPVHRRANAWRIGPNSRFAVAWTNARTLESVDPTEGLQDVTIIDRAGKKPTATRLSVGYRPSQVFIDEAEERAYVVSQPGITVIHLTHEDGPRVERELFLPEHASGGRRDVSITPDGGLAFVRLEGSAEILVVDLTTDTRVTVKLPAVVTDLDVSADGARAVAVMRRSGSDSLGSAGFGGASSGDLSRVAVLPVATITTDPEDFDLVEIEGLFGSAVLSQDGTRALLYTNGVPQSLLAILDLTTGDHREVDLMAPVRAVFLSEDGAHAVALLSPPAGSVARGAFSLVPVAEEFPPKLEGTNAPARFVSLSSDPPRALITTDGGETGPHDVFLARFPDLRVDRSRLPSAPLASGVMPEAGKGFVAQEHPEGRVTFVTLADGATRTLTGFELGGKVVE